MNNDKLKVLIPLIASIFSLIGVFLLFFVEGLLPSFPLKFSNVKKEISVTNNINKTINEYMSLDPQAVITDLEEKAQKSTDNKNIIVQKMSHIEEPEVLDYGSFLVYLNQEALKNSLQVLDIKFNDVKVENLEDKKTKPEGEEGSEGSEGSEGEEKPKGEEGSEGEEKPKGEEGSEGEKEEDKDKTDDKGDNTTTDKENSKPEDNKESEKEEDKKVDPTVIAEDRLNTYPQIKNLSPSVITVKLTGPYSHIQNLLKTMPKTLGNFSYIDNVKIWKSKDSLAKDGVNKYDDYLFSSEKNSIIEFDIITFNKTERSEESGKSKS